jgi:hypothetical protein
MTGRASDGSDSYSYIWSVAACSSAISGETSCAAEGRSAEPPVSTLLLSAVHPVAPYTHTQPSIAIKGAVWHPLSAWRFTPSSTFTCTPPST